MMNKNNTFSLQLVVLIEPLGRELREAIYDISSFTNVPPIIQDFVDNVIKGPVQTRYKALVTLDIEGGKGKTAFFKSVGVPTLYFTGAVIWQAWQKQRAGAQFLCLDDVDVSCRSPLFKTETLRSVMTGQAKFSVSSPACAHSWELDHGLPCVFLTNNAEILHHFKFDAYFKQYCECHVLESRVF